MRRSAIIALVLAHASLGQVPTVLTRTDLVRLVLENHPMARQAALRPELGEASVRSARGGFDPVAAAGYEEKRFDEKNYFQLFDASLKVPTWYGIELLGGFQSNQGDFLDPQMSTPDDGLIKAGVSAAIGQGLIIDQRRATLRRAQAFLRASEGERRQMLNALLLQALGDHADWVASHEQLRISESALDLASDRFAQVRGSYLGGDRPAIDTLEAYLQVQDRRMRVEQSRLATRNAALRLSNHLWDPYQRPLELQPEAVPDPGDLRTPGLPLPSDSTIARVIEQHPTMLQARARIDQLEVDRRLRAEMLKPELGLKYQWLGDAANAEGTRGDGHQMGVGFRMPLLLRKERGELSMARLRLTDAELAMDRERNTLRNKVRERANEIATLSTQVQLGAAMVRDYERLLAGESQRFRAGESSLFLVNGRELPLIESRLKQVDLELKLRKAWFALDHDAGILWSAWQP